ncbi:MAG: ABC transporter permease [Candidatus Cyclobacteriaceae bacterium M3_2C_046]
MNWIKVALRNALKHKIQSFAKLFGISIAFAVIIFSTSYVYYETSFDKMVPDRHKIFRVIMYGEINGSSEDFAVTSSQMAYSMVQEIPEIKQAIRVKPTGNSSLAFEDHVIYDNKHWYADSGFFEFFSLPLRKAQDHPLAAPDQITISESLAQKLFKSADNALNKTALVRGQEVKIAGVFKDFPANFHIQTDIIQSIEKINPDQFDWGSQSFYTYFKSHDAEVQLERLNFKLTKLVYSYHNEDIDGSNAKNWEDLKGDDNNYVFFRAEPLTAIHFSQHKFDPAITASKTYVYGAIILSLLVLIISSLNYVNLTLANLTTRLREIGVRKTIGALNHHITRQFLQESILFWIIGFGLAILIYQSAGTMLARYLDLHIDISEQEVLKLMAVTLILLVVFNLLTIYFPIRYITQSNILNLLKAKNRTSKRFSTRTMLLFIQFGLSALIITSAIVVEKQVSYLLNKERGYNPDHVIMLSLWELDQEKRKSFKHQLEAHSAVKNVATSGNYFGQDPSMNSAYFEAETDENYFHTSILKVDDAFAATFDFDITEGRFFQKNMSRDEKAVVINQAASRAYQGSGELINNQLILDGEIYQIIGIVKDFNFRSLYHRIQPLVMTRVENMEHLYIKTDQDKVKDVVNLLQEQWQAFGISRPLDYELHQQVIAYHYNKDQQAKKLLLILSFISIVIAAVGLYAISLFTILRKTKEIGIRKVNGASFKNIMVMLNLEFTKWVMLAYIMAMPLTWYVMYTWLQNFAYKTSIQWWVFALAGAGMLLISLFTVSWQSWKAARKNPVDALRSE